MSRFNITRANPKGGNGFATGKHAIAICHRSGFKFPYSEMVYEPGTQFWIHKRESDEEWNLVGHDQNYQPSKLTERVGLKWARPDTRLSVGAVVCLKDLFTGGGNYVTSAGAVSVGSGTCTVSVGTGVSGGFTGTVFSNPTNSQYYIVIFQGI